MTFHSLSPHIISIIAPFSILFSFCSWRIASTLLLGTIVARGKRTVTAVLRTIGHSQDISFSKYHRILNSLNWSLKHGAFILLKMLLQLVGKDRPVILIDETLERRKGKKKRVKFLTNTSIWGVDSYAPVAIRWVLVVDP